MSKMPTILFHVLTVTFSIQWTNITSSIYSALLKKYKRQTVACLSYTDNIMPIDNMAIDMMYQQPVHQQALYCHSLHRKFLLLN